MLLGLLRPTRGDVALFGLDLQHNRSEILARTGSLVETPSLYEHLTARENLEIPRRILDAPHTDIERVLRIVGLENASRNLVRTFSLGMKQRLGLAQAFLGKRDLLILDEPTNGLDPAGIQEMRSLIRTTSCRTRSNGLPIQSLANRSRTGGDACWNALAGRTGFSGID